MYGGEQKWLRRFAEDEGSWYEMLCDEVLPSWMSRETKWDFYPSIEDALDSESTSNDYENRIYNILRNRKAASKSRCLPCC